MKPEDTELAERKTYREETGKINPRPKLKDDVLLNDGAVVQGTYEFPEAVELQT